MLVNPHKQLLFREDRTSSELAIGNRIFVDKIVERSPCSGDALFGQESGCILNGHAVRFDSFVLAPEIGEFRDDGADLLGDGRPQFRGGGYDYRIIHYLVLMNVRHCPPAERVAQR